MTSVHFCCKPPNISCQKRFLLNAYQEFLQKTLPETFVGTVATCLSPLAVGLHDPKYRSAKNYIEMGRGAMRYRVGVFITLSQLIMSGCVVVGNVSQREPELLILSCLAILEVDHIIPIV